MRRGLAAVGLAVVVGLLTGAAPASADTPCWSVVGPFSQEYVPGGQVPVQVDARCEVNDIRTRFWWDADAASGNQSGYATCNQMNCSAVPATISNYDASTPPEGRHAIRIQAMWKACIPKCPDFDEGSVTLHFAIDRTPPSPPTDFDVDYGSAGIANVNWEDGDDPDLADGTPGSGVTGYRFRYAPAGGSWSAWMLTPDDFDIPNAVGGQVYSVEVQSVDAVGNTSVSATGSVTVPVRDPFTSDDFAWFGGHDLTDPDFDAPWDPDGIDNQDPGGSARTAASPGGASQARAAAAQSTTDLRVGVFARMTSCGSEGSARTASTQQVCVFRDARGKSKRKEKELECGEEVRDELGRTRARRDCPQDFDEPVEWHEVYRVIAKSDPNKVIYVGMTKRTYQVRCPEHGYALSQCELVIVVPGRFMALAVEQFLMEVYGFNSKIDNRNYSENPPTGKLYTAGWFSGRAPSLHNGRRNFSAKRPNPLYCPAKMAGWFALNAYRPQFYGVYPPLQNNWWPNFPGRDCLSADTWQNLYFNNPFLRETQPIANPR
jgi:hypothetical protein